MWILCHCSNTAENEHKTANHQAPSYSCLKCLQNFWGLLARPIAHCAPQIDELPEVIGVVISQHQGFAQNSLAVTVRDFCAQVRLGVLYQLNHLLQVALKRLDRLLPRSRVRRDWRLRPVSLGKAWRD